MPGFGWNVFVFAALALGIQAIHDILFYFLVIKPIPQGHNEMIDVFKTYADEGQYKVILADSAMTLSTVFLASALASVPLHITTFIGALAMYAVPYILTTRNVFSRGDKN